MLEKGTIVCSRAGHDTDRLYAVIAVLSEDFVLVADGKYRLVSSPKLKRQKHLRFRAQNATLSGLIESGKLQNSDLIRELSAVACADNSQPKE